MKRVGYLKDRIVSLENLYEAYRKARKGKHEKMEVRKFEENFDDNIREIRKQLTDGTISLGNYRFFTIRDPKKRRICAAPFKERVVQHAIMNVCHEYFDRQLIDSTYATRKGKGVYAALEKTKWAMAHFKYSVKLDFRKYYDSIRHDVLKAKLRRMFKDKWLLDLFDRIIDTYEVSPGRGLPIGNLTSQYFGNLYLSDLDHKAKELWGAPIYTRYMDDIQINGNDKEQLKQCVKAMTDYSADSLGLDFKSPVYAKSSTGQVFLGYRVLPNRLLLSGRSKRRFRTKLLSYERNIAECKWTEQEYEEHITPLLAFTLHAESMIFRRECMRINKGDGQGVGRTA